MEGCKYSIRHMFVKLSVLAACIMSGCSFIQTYDIHNVVQTYLDLTYHGIYDEEVSSIFGLSKDEALRKYEDDLSLDTDMFLQNILGIEDVSQEAKDHIKGMYQAVYEKASYGIGGSEKDQVSVTVYPEQAFACLEDSVLTDMLRCAYAEQGLEGKSILDLSAEELQAVNSSYAIKVSDLVLSNLDEVDHGESVVVAVKVSKNGRDLYLEKDGLDMIDSLIIDLKI